MNTHCRLAIFFMTKQFVADIRQSQYGYKHISSSNKLRIILSRKITQTLIKKLPECSFATTDIILGHTADDTTCLRSAQNKGAQH